MKCEISMNLAAVWHLKKR